MYRYSAYIMKHLASSACLVTASLTGIIWLTQALRFIDFIVTRGISFGGFLELTLLLIPSLVLFILPFALLCSVLYVYYRLMMDSEMLVLASAGLSRLQLALPALKIGLLATLVAYAISLYVLPVSYSKFKNTQVFLRDNYASLLLQEEVFNSPVDGLTVFIRERDKNGRLRGIIVHDSREEDKPPVTMMAEEGQLIQTPQGPRFILYRGNRQEVKDGKLSFLHFDQYTLDISFYGAGDHKRPRQPEEMFVPELLSPDATGEEGWRLVAEGNNRLAWPLFSLALSGLAAAGLMGGEFNRRGHWRRVTAVVLGAGLSLSFGVGLLNLAAHQHWMIVLMYLNALGVLAFSFWLMQDRVRREK